MQKLRAEKDSSIKKELKRRYEFNYREEVEGDGDGVSWTCPILKFLKGGQTKEAPESQKVSRRKKNDRHHQQKHTHRDREIQRNRKMEIRKHRLA